jgi:hypothetical protein
MPMNYCSHMYLQRILLDVCLKIRMNYEQVTNTFISSTEYVTIKTQGAGINVYRNITLECQTKVKQLFCEDCLARKDCKLAR